jgi:hypothetical protein
MSIDTLLTSSLLRWLLGRRRAGGERGPGATVLRYPGVWQVLAWTLLLVPLAGIFALAAFSPPRPDDLKWFVGLVLGFGALGLALVLEIRGVAHRLRPDGLERVTPWRPRRFLPWSRLTVLRYSESMQSFRLVTDQGDGTWLSQYLSGLGAFAAAVLAQVRPEVLNRNPGARARLVELAAAFEAGGRRPIA